jgi:hypothetical protein
MLDPSEHFLGPAVPCSWFPFLGTRGEHAWVSRATMNFWKHDEEDETEPSNSVALEFARRPVCSFFPVLKDYLSVLRGSWEDGNCPDGDSYGWVRPTTIIATRLGARRSSDRHLIRNVMPFGFDLGDHDT